jgi:trk system potassium uptake protein TrkA
VVTVQVVVIGAGEVGTSIAADLAPDHDIVIVDIDESRVEDIKYDIDVLTLVGDGTKSSVLIEAGAVEADMLIASTDDDKTNLVICGTAETIGDPFQIARVKSAEYQRTWEQTGEAFGADFVICANLQAAGTIVDVIGLPSAVEVSSFVGGLVQMAEFDITEGSPITGQTVAEADRFDSLTFAALFRDDDLVLPRGSTIIKTDDRMVVIGRPESVQGFAQQIAPVATPDRGDDIVIIGGGEIGYHTARMLEAREFSPKLIEQDSDRARALAEELPETLVMNHDPTDTEFLRRERLDEANVLVSALDSDENNMLVSVLAKRIGAERVISLVDRSDYVQLFQEIGIDAAVSPRDVTAEEIIRFTHEKVAENIAVLEGGKAEVLELELDADSEFVGRSIRDIDESVDSDIVFGAVSRRGTEEVPRGDTVLERGDNVVIFVESEFVDEMLAMG